MSHEIRTPINTIIGLNEMILRDAPTDEIKEDAQNIESAGKILLHLINDILDMSKLESGKMDIITAPFDVADLIADVAGMIWVRAKEKGLKFSIDVAPDMPKQVTGDEVRIKQILINLLNNSVKYTNEGSVELAARCEDTSDPEITKLIFSITDTGIGIKKDSIPYLFDAFT
jgi:signal transduction histidine kinase